MLRSKLAARRSAEPSRPASARSRRARQPFLARIVNQWWTRLLNAIYQGSLSSQEEEYESHSTTRDYVWNTIGTTVWGMSLPILSIVASQLAGAEQAGMFSMAFATGMLLMYAANYGVRNYQVSDIDETHAFSSYQIQRWASTAMALVLGILYCTIRDYQPYMATICFGVYLFKLVDGAADVYEGRLQQADKLYLAGISQTIRSVAVFLVFTVLLFVMRDIAVASVGMGIAAVASLVLVTIPLALLETEKSRHWRFEEVIDLFRQCFPLFAALFLFNLIETMPKLVMEGALPYDNQLYFNALYFPSQSIQIIIGFIYKPQLVRLSNIWANPRKRRRFDFIILAVMAVIVAVTAGVGVFMATIGIPLTGFLYGVDFEQFRFLCYLMVVAGGVIAAIDFLYAIVTVLRRQGEVMRLYLVAFAAVTLSSLVLVHLIGLAGAVVSYLASMTLLLALLVLDYFRIRQAIRRERNPFLS
ncbi:MULTISPECIES: lipopolysaccharide biosynthesis protein [Enorma]|uniref:lipopolysaccharide biosynthesis protein n=1 Tax=Enorma TaxID=1472762 RepID=UPI00036075A3|nr:MULTISPECIES: lipopolysaccharide biosynthesis protein [Enorma]